MSKFKDFKHVVKFRTGIGSLARITVTFIGILFMKAARKCFKWSLNRCSWCGRNSGMGIISSKGHRCINGHCQDQP